MNGRQLWIVPRFVSVTISTVMRVNYYRTRQEKQNKKGHSIIKFFSNTHNPDQLNIIWMKAWQLLRIMLTFNRMIGRRESIVWLEINGYDSDTTTKSKHNGLKWNKCFLSRINYMHLRLIFIIIYIFKNNESPLPPQRMIMGIICFILSLFFSISHYNHTHINFVVDEQL